MNQETPAALAALRVSPSRELRFVRGARGIVVREYRLRDGVWTSHGGGVSCALGELRSVAAVLQRLANDAESRLR